MVAILSPGRDNHDDVAPRPTLTTSADRCRLLSHYPMRWLLTKGAVEAAAATSGREARKESQALQRRRTGPLTAPGSAPLLLIVDQRAEAPEAGQCGAGHGMGRCNALFVRTLF